VGEVACGIASFLVVGPADPGAAERVGDRLSFGGEVAFAFLFEGFDVGVDAAVVEGDAVQDMKVGRELLGQVDRVSQRHLARRVSVVADDQRWRGG
jgi:hypothetical protein